MTAPTFLGKPCKRNHLTTGTLRYLSNGHCVDCTQMRPQMPREQRREYMRNWRTIRKKLGRQS
jgi:hypothetical protein